jgi:hypothetical protein
MITLAISQQIKSLWVETLPVPLNKLDIKDNIFPALGN